MYVVSTLWLADTDSYIEIQKALRFLGLWQARVQIALYGEVGDHWLLVARDGFLYLLYM